MTTAALLLWVVIAPVVFATRGVLPAIIWAVLFPVMFLPEAYSIDLPGLPNLDKRAVISIGLMIGLVSASEKFKGLATAQPVTQGAPLFGTAILFLFAIVVIGVFLTVLNNSEALQFGPTRIRGLRLWDAISFLGKLIFFIIPFFMARRYLATPDAHRTMLVALVIAGLLYTPLMLIEMRLSPQLHNWVYGFHQHSFAQHVRDGYRPKVFMQHGLWVGFFMLTAFMAALALWKREGGGRWLGATLWLFVILAISRNFGALAIAILLAGVFLGTWRALQLRIIGIIAICILIFPALRQAQLVPTEQIVSMAASVSQERADSLQFRLRNEDALLARALEKPLTGWGIFGREQIFRESDGKHVSISEGRWTQTIGVQGWSGYIGLFGLLTLPLIFLKATRKRKEVPPETVVLALIAAGNLIYMIPNSTLTPLGLLIFGALAGFVQYDSQTSTALDPTTHSDPGQTTRKGPRYSRFPPAPAAPPKARRT